MRDEPLALKTHSIQSPLVSDPRAPRDVVPLTLQGRVVAIAVQLLGVSFFVGFTSLWVTRFSELEDEEKRNRLKRIETELKELSAKLDHLIK